MTRSRRSVRNFVPLPFETLILLWTIGIAWLALTGGVLGVGRFAVLVLLFGFGAASSWLDFLRDRRPLLLIGRLSFLLALVCGPSILI